MAMSSLQSLDRQRGFGFWGITFNIVVLAGVLILVLRVLPSYLTYMTVKDTVSRAVEQHDPERQSIQQLRDRIRQLLSTNQVYDVKVDDIEIYRERGRIVVDASYESRFPMFWLLDGVMSYDDLVFEVASP